MTVITRGGKRPGAGRPKASGRFGETTRALRVPLSKWEAVQEVIAPSYSTGVHIPLYSSQVAAGLPTPASEHISDYLDLNHHLVKEPTATFLVRASGDSMLDAGIHSGDLLVVDKSLSARHGHIVIAALNGELTVKRLVYQGERIELQPANRHYTAIVLTEHLDLVIWGVVTQVIHTLV